MTWLHGMPSRPRVPAAASRFETLKAPSNPVRSSPPPQGEARLRVIPTDDGDYRESRGGVRNVFKTGRFIGMQRATAGEDGRLQFLTREWVETEPLLFREADGPGWLVFEEDERGEVVRALRGIGGHSVLIKLPWWHGLLFHQLMALAILLLLLWPLIHRPLWRARRWWRTVRAGGTAATAHWLAAILRVGAFVFAAGFGVGATTWALSFGAEPSAAMMTALVLPFILAPVTLGAAWYCFRLWREHEGTLKSRLGYTGLVAGAFLLLWWVDYWNVLLTRA